MSKKNLTRKRRDSLWREAQGQISLGTINQKNPIMMGSIKKNMLNTHELGKSNTNQNKSTTTRDIRKRVPKVGKSSAKPSFSRGG